MTALPLVITAMCILAITYRLYGTFMASKVLHIAEDSPTPAHVLEDGQDYVPAKRAVSFGHHFAAIAAAGPLVGPVLAAQFGYLPGFIWLLVGAVIGGAVHDLVVLFASMRQQGASLSEIAKAKLGPLAGWCTGLAMLFIITITMAGLSMVVVHALEHNPWGTFTVFATIPVAMLMGLFTRLGGSLKTGTVLGLLFITLAIVAGPGVASSALGHWFDLSASTLSFLLPLYAFFASILPVWLLLAPRDYLSSFMKIGVFIALIVGVFILNPVLQFPALTPFIHGGGPILAGPVWPFVSITIACGAISGFHAFISAGTTPKMLDRWSDMKPVAFGAMLTECLVAVMALIAATSLHPADYFAINATPEKFAAMQLTPVDLTTLSKEVGLDLSGRTGGAVSLAAGMTYIFHGIPWFKNVAAYFFQFVIMFEAVFILTAIDAGTRVARYLVQDFFGEVYKPLKRLDWIPGMLFSGALASVFWGYLLYSGNIGGIWALFGVSNQLMASIGLIIGVTIILRVADRKIYALTCLIPLLYLYVTVNYAGLWMVSHVYLAAGKGHSVVNAALSIIMLLLGVVILALAVRDWLTRIRLPKPMRIDPHLRGPEYQALHASQVASD